MVLPKWGWWELIRLNSTSLNDSICSLAPRRRILGVHTYIPTLLSVISLGNTTYEGCRKHGVLVGAFGTGYIHGIWELTTAGRRRPEGKGYDPFQHTIWEQRLEGKLPTNSVSNTNQEPMAICKYRHCIVYNSL